jgi:chain length determinant protein (polysaccharide antigen chain regulator)
MTYNNNNAVTRSNDPEQIDLIDLVLQLWRGKWLIGAFIAIAILIAGAYLMVAKEQWSSSSIITQPDSAQIGTYSNALNILYGPAAPRLADIQANVFNRYNAAISALAGTLENQEKPEKLQIDQVVKGQPAPLQVSYVSDSAQAAQKQLAVYIQQIDEQIGKELFSDLKDNVEQQIASLKISLGNQEEVAQDQKDLRIKQIEEALKYAEAANITKPQLQQTQYVTQETMFLLGTEGLAAMIERESSRPLALSDDYYKNKQRLLDIEKLNIDPKSIHAYRYVMKPDLPIRRDSPKRGIVLILSVLLGGLIGSGVVLGRNALRNYQRKA